MPAENFRAVVLISGRIPPKGARDRYAPRATARTFCEHLPFGQCDADTRPAKMNKAEIHLPSLAIHQRLPLRVDSEARIRLASARVRSLRLSHVFAYQ